MTDDEQSREKERRTESAALRAASYYDTLTRRIASNRRAQIIIIVVLVVFVTVPSILLLLLPIWVDLSEKRLEGLGYAGIFLANLASTATVFIPVPGLTAAGQALIVSGGENLNPVPAGILGGLGMGLGEITAYAAGMVGRELAEGRQIGGPSWFRRTVESMIRWIGWLMAHYGMLTLFILSAIPNPTFEIAGLTAGSMRMKFWRFMLPVLSGKIVRGLALAFFGAYSLDFLGS